MSVQTKLSIDKQYVEQISKDRNEPDWLTNFRLEAYDLVDELQLPKPDKTKIDNWNFTKFNYQLTEKADVSDDMRELLGENKKEQNYVVQQNGGNAVVQISEELQKQGVIFTDMKTAFEKHSDKVQKYFMKEVAPASENKLLALHAALVNGGVFIYVPKNVEVNVPLQTVFALSGENSSLFNHVLIVVEENSSLTYVENYVSDNAKGAIANIVTEVFVGAGSRVTYGAVDNFGEEITTYVVRRANVDKDGRIEWALGQMNDGDTISENTTNLVGDGSYADSKTVSIGRGVQKQNFTTNIVHYGKHSEGYILAHGVMTEEATSIFNGISKIEHKATKSHGEQTERVLMLSEKARGDANPILLIDEDDVTAGHAASVGKIDPMQMFYLMSRGISRQEAERLIIHGFLAPVVDELPIEAVKERLTAVIERKVK